MATESLARAFASTRSILSRVTPHQLGAPTPCASWNVRQLVNHMISAPRVGAAALTGAPAPAMDQDFASGDFVAAYDETAEQALAAFERQGALERSVTLPFGEVPAPLLLHMITVDQFTHGWDLARATDQPADLDPELALTLLAQTEIPAQLRGEDGSAPFGPAQPVPEGAAAADKLAAYLGRRP